MSNFGAVNVLEEIAQETFFEDSFSFKQEEKKTITAVALEIHMK